MRDFGTASPAKFFHTIRLGLRACDLTFIAGIIVFASIGLRALPYDFTDLCYLFSLESGDMVLQEWVHPLYVPVLGVYRNLLRLLGYDGRMLVPVESLNIAVAISALTLMYLWARKFSPVAASLGVLVTAVNEGFWQAAVRPTPYALALLCVLATLRLCQTPAATRQWRLVLLAVSTALAMGFHLSAMALVPVVLCCVWLHFEGRDRKAFLLAVLRYLGFLVATLVLEYVVLIMFHQVDLAVFLGERADFGKFFKGIEQIPGTSIYSSRSLAAQASMLLGNLWSQVGSLFVLMGVYGGAGAVLGFRGLRKSGSANALYGGPRFFPFCPSLVFSCSTMLSTVLHSRPPVSCQSFWRDSSRRGSL